MSMAQVELSPLIKTMSGTISKRRLSDGTTISYVVTKKGRLYVRTSRPRSTPVQSAELERRNRFGLIASAVGIIRRNVFIPAGSGAIQHLWKDLGEVYDVMKLHRKNITPEDLVKWYQIIVK